MDCEGDVWTTTATSFTSFGLISVSSSDMSELLVEEAWACSAAILCETSNSKFSVGGCFLFIGDAMKGLSPGTRGI